MSTMNELLSGTPVNNAQQNAENQSKPSYNNQKNIKALSNNDEDIDEFCQTNESCINNESVQLNNNCNNENSSSNTSGLGASILSSSTSQYDRNNSNYSVELTNGCSDDRRVDISEELSESDVRNISNESFDEKNIDSRSYHSHVRDNSPLSDRSSDGNSSSAESAGDIGSRSQHKDGFSSLPLEIAAAAAAIAVHQQNFDFDPFGDFTSGIENKHAQRMLIDAPGKQQISTTSQLDQQLVAQVLASAIQSSHGKMINQTSSNTNSNSNSSSRSTLLDNIELLTAKYKQQQNQNQHLQNQQQTQQLDNNCLNSLLLAMASTGIGGNGNTSEFLNSPLLKRQSAGTYNNLSHNTTNMLFSTPITNLANVTSPSNSNTNLNLHSAQNSRLNSTPNLASFSASNNGQSSIINDQQSQNRFFNRSGLNSSMSASSSAYNLSSPTSHQNHHAAQGVESSSNISNQNNNSSMFEDDDVFSSSTGFSPSLTAAQSNQEAFAQLYRSLLLKSNINSANMNELITNQSLGNLSSLNLGSEGALNSHNSANFMNISANHSGNVSTNASSLLNQFKSSLNGSFVNNSAGNGLSSNISPMTAAAVFFKQRQSINGNNNVRIGNSASLQSSPIINQPSNIAALTSATNSMASLLSSVSSQQQFDVNKRRVNSVASSALNFNSSGINGSNQSASLLTHNAGPNATMLLQNSSLASSARLNMSSSSTASVLGSNSALTQTLNALHQQQNPPSFGVGQSPSGSSSHNLLSALSLSTTSPNAKPLRSERLPPHMVEEIIKQGKIRRKQGGKKEVCVFCRNNSEKEQFYTSHTLKDASNNVACPILRLYQCPICHASGDQAHTIKYCPYAEKDSAYIKLFKDSGKMAAALFMNTLTGGNGTGSSTPPSSNTPPDTPSPIVQQGPPNLLNQGNNNQLNFMNSPQISSTSPASAHLSLVQALSNFQNNVR